jgi:hypothetical protein
MRREVEGGISGETFILMVLERSLPQYPSYGLLRVSRLYYSILSTYDVRLSTT